MPQRQLLSGGQTGLRWGGTTYRPYDPKTEEAFGWAELGVRRATPDTLYSLASISKPFTTTGEPHPTPPHTHPIPTN